MQRKPTELKVLDGSFRADRHGDPHSVPASGEPEPPTTLSVEERACWDELVPLLLEMGVAKKQDSKEIANMCRWWVEFTRAMDYLKNLKPSHKRYPRAVQATVITFNAFERIVGRFGLTPADRAKIRANTAQTSKIRTRSKEA